jgi:hypothetical protein
MSGYGPAGVYSSLAGAYEGCAAGFVDGPAGLLPESTPTVCSAACGYGATPAGGRSEDKPYVPWPFPGAE